MRLTTKKFRMLLSALLCLLLLFSLSACTGSTKPLEIADGTCTIPGENLQFTIPENSFAFSAASSVFSEEWTLAGVTDPTSRVKEYEKMGTLANIISVGGNNNVFITKKQSSMTSEIFNMTESGDEAVAAVKADHPNQDSGIFHNIGFHGLPAALFFQHFRNIAVGIQGLLVFH